MPGSLTTLSNANKKALATRHLGGETYEDLVGYAHLSLAQIRALFRSQQMRDIMAQEQGYLEGAVARANLSLHMSLEEACDKQKGLLKSKSEEMRFKSSRYIIDRTLPPPAPAPTEVTHYHHARIEVLDSIADRLVDARIVNIVPENEETYAPYILRGTEGIETAEPSEPTPELGVGGPVGSGPTSERDADGKPEPPHPT